MKKKLLLLSLMALLLLLLWTTVKVVVTSGESMLPTYKPGETIICLRKWREPKVGDTVLIRHHGRLIIKRVAALPGERPPEGVASYWGGDTIPDGYIFVLGDNPDKSRDSRYENFGLIPMDEIWGFPLK